MVHDKNWPRPMGEDAYHGLTGRVVDLIEPQTEADPANLLISFLLSFGNSIGRSAYILIEDTRHYANEFAVLVGPTAMARKGTGFDRIKRVYDAAEELSTRNETWTTCIRHGMSTGEGLIAQLSPSASKDNEPPPPTDTRLMIVEPEFARSLIVMNRPDNILSSVIRTAWEQGHLHLMTRKPLEAHDAHISIIGHITTDELRKRLNVSELANGFANRFLFAMVKRMRLLPLGGHQVDYNGIANQLNSARDKAQGFGPMTLAGSFKAIWPEQYGRLIKNAQRPGMFGAITAEGRHMCSGSR